MKAPYKVSGGTVLVDTTPEPEHVCRPPRKYSYDDDGGGYYSIELPADSVFQCDCGNKFIVVEEKTERRGLLTGKLNGKFDYKTTWEPLCTKP